MKQILTEREELELASKVVKLLPEIQGICRTADQYVRDPRVVSALVDKLTPNKSELSECSTCNRDFDLEAEGGIEGHFGMIPVAFCPECKACIYDLGQQLDQGDIDE